MSGVAGAPDDADWARAPRNRAFLGGLALANVGAFLSFLPLLQVIVPLKAARLAPGDAAGLLSAAAATGAVVAGGANFAAGWLSDRTRSRFGRRRPWILAGVAGVVGAYALIAAARTPLQLVAALGLYQLAFNVMFAPFLALVPDRVPERAQGWASALVALGYPVAAAVGAILVGGLVAGEEARLLALGAIVAATIVPFTLALGPDPPPGSTEAPAPLARSEPVRASVTAVAAEFAGVGPFALGWLGRCGVMTGNSLAQTFLLFYLLALPPEGGIGAGPHRAEHAFALLGVVFGGVTAGACLLFGRWSDRARRRRSFVVGGALTMGAGFLALAAAPMMTPAWPWVVGAYALYALGAGCHTAVDFAMMVALLPSRDRPARDLGVLNVSNIAPQIAAPLLAAALLRLPGADIRWVFAAAAVFSAAGAACVVAMRGVR